VRIEARRIGDEPFEEILDAALLVQLAEKGGGIGAVKSGGEDEQRKDAAPDSSTGYGRVGAGELPYPSRRDRRPAVLEAGPFFSA
jgi:hypothetical protein